MKHVVLFSGGLGSWATAKLVVAEHGTQNTILLFTDTKMEDPDLYRFLHDASINVGATLVTLADGRTPWQIFFDTHFLGNSRIDPCSRILKRELATKWFEENFTPETCIRYVGIDWDEWHRYVKIRDMVAPWQVRSPLCQKMFTKRQIKEWAIREGLKIPRLYDLGFEHNNCGGFCVKAGQAHFANLLRTLPDRYHYHECMEQRFRMEYGPFTVLRKNKQPITLKQFREHLESGGEFDKHEWGGCSCFAGSTE